MELDTELVGIDSEKDIVIHIQLAGTVDFVTVGNSQKYLREAAYAYGSTVLAKNTVVLLQMWDVDWTVAGVAVQRD